MKSLTIIIIAFALGFGAAIAVPAKAEAPRLTYEQRVSFYAMQFPKEYAHNQLKFLGFGKKEYSCLSQLWGKESAWNYKAKNKKSTAYGIAQLLGETSKEPHVQINKGIRYIIHRYETPCSAWKFWKRNYYY